MATLKSRDVSAAASAMARKRLWSMTAEQRKALASKAGRASWSDMSAEERHLEGRRRAVIRKRNRMKALSTMPLEQKLLESRMKRAAIRASLKASRKAKKALA